MEVNTFFKIKNNIVKLKNIQYPSISKPIYSTNGSNMTILYDDNDLGKLNNHNNIQKFIEYEYEYGAYMLCIDGVIVTQKIIRFKYKKNHIKQTQYGGEITKPYMNSFMLEAKREVTYFSKEKF